MRYYVVRMGTNDFFLCENCQPVYASYPCRAPLPVELRGTDCGQCGRPVQKADIRDSCESISLDSEPGEAPKKAPSLSEVAERLLRTQERLLESLWGEQWERSGLKDELRSSIAAARVFFPEPTPEEAVPKDAKTGKLLKRVRTATGWRWE